MTRMPKPPDLHQQFVQQYPKLEQAWELIADEGREGPLDGRIGRLVKLGVAIGAMREGAVHASVRKALALGIEPEELYQVVALSAGTLGLPSTAAVYSWVREVIEPPEAPPDD
jgi:alkylhydroperoxidase/carboxymuconolactone decarboxylase family protein YurZ